MAFNEFYMMFLLQLKTLIESGWNFLHNIGLYRRRLANYPADDRQFLLNQVVCITGANSGIGLYTARTFARLGATVLMLCRDLKRSEPIRQSIVEELKKNDNNNDYIDYDKRIRLFELDLSSLDSVRKCAKEIQENYDHIDYLINNAGIMMCPKMMTVDNYEQQFQINHLGHFLLTNLLMKNLLKSKTGAKIINLSSIAHLPGQIHFENINFNGNNSSYTPLKSYAQSKLANILFTRELSKRLSPHTNVRTFAVHPGLVDTELGRHLNTVQRFFLRILNRLILIQPKFGAQTTLYCAFNVDDPEDSGGYFANCQRIKNMVPNATNENDAEKLWEISCKMCGIDNVKEFK